MSMGQPDHDAQTLAGPAGGGQAGPAVIAPPPAGVVESDVTAALAELMGDGVFRGVLGRRAAAAVRQRYELEQVLLNWDQVFQAARGGIEEGAKA